MFGIFIISRFLEIGNRNFEKHQKVQKENRHFCDGISYLDFSVFCLAVLIEEMSITRMLVH